MSVTHFTVPGVPVAQPRQRHRVVHSNGKAFATSYTPTRDPVNAFKASVQHSYRAVTQDGPSDFAVSLLALFVMPRPKSKRWKTKPMPRYPDTRKPDIDNLLKSLKDALTGLAWIDDSQVTLVTASKWVAAGDEQPHCEVGIYPVPTRVG